jgi:hypothetical protein
MDFRMRETPATDRFYPPLIPDLQGGAADHERESTMYDNSATMALTGSGITMLGQTASLTAVTVGGALVVGLGAVLALSERLKRRRGVSR